MEWKKAHLQFETCFEYFEIRGACSVDDITVDVYATRASNLPDDFSRAVVVIDIELILIIYREMVIRKAGRLSICSHLVTILISFVFSLSVRTCNDEERADTDHIEECR